MSIKKHIATSPITYHWLIGLTESPGLTEFPGEGSFITGHYTDQSNSLLLVVGLTESPGEGTP
ncbi:5559_t:CDS:2 [Rhizophagus irregularis]|uniref:Uncharacterized protein n=1 Tax=Rhizophagus irregularis (strain DAOM 181602 / DAOM 197198 / MUCL 43194) TaxID=747089 RepID=U9US45_RHIID|nr:5559_t:CDS:2 [Rhizophagus irregularis]